MLSRCSRSPPPVALEAVPSLPLEAGATNMVIELALDLKRYLKRILERNQKRNLKCEPKSDQNMASDSLRGPYHRHILQDYSTS